MYSKSQSRRSCTSVSTIDRDTLNEEDQSLYDELMTATDTKDLPEIAEELRSTLWEFRDTWSSKTPSKCKVLSHIIEPTTKRPLVERPRRHSLEQNAVTTKEVEQMEKDKIVRPSSSPYATEVVLVRRKDGPWRVCIDFRLLNQHTKQDKYPLPRISTLLRSIKDSSVFCALDLRAGFWNIQLDPDSCKYTAFRTPNGLYEFVVMPFGLVNAPATFQRVMDFIFQDLYTEGLAVYLDDLLLHGKSVDHVLRLLRIVLQRLRHFGLRLNLTKSNFFHKTLLYLGHIISQGTIRPNPKKIEVLSKVRAPTTQQEVRKLMGLLSYFRQYIPSFADYSCHFTDLLKKTILFQWTENHQFSLEFCLYQLSTSMLALPLDNDEFVLETDASNYAAGAILSVRRDNQLIPVEFASVTLKDAELRWPTREKEGYAIFWALNHFDHYLRGRTFDLYTDHESLLYMSKSQTGKLARWSCRLAEYNFTLHHKSGSLMDHVDFFSRFIVEDHDYIADRMTYLPSVPSATPCLILEPSIPCNASPVSLPSSPNHQPSLLLPTPFPSYQEIITAQRTHHPPPTGKPFSLSNGIIYYNHCLWIPPPLRSQVIAACHIIPPFRHVGYKKTHKTILRTCNWPGLYLDVSSFVRSCLSCQRLRPRIEHFQGQFLQEPPVTTLFEQVHIDHWGPCLWVKRQPLVLTIVDCLGRWCECIVVKDATAETTAKAFIDNWICRYGVPRTVISDKGSAFWSEVFNRCAKLIGFSHLRTTSRHPEGNALVESFHRTLKKNIASMHIENKDIPFSTAVQLAAYSYRSTIHLSLGDSPAFITFGMDLRPPIENDWRFLHHADDRQRAKIISEIRLQQIERAHAQFVHLSQLDQPGRTHDLFELGDIILAKLSPNERTAYNRFEKDKKIAPKFSMPARVIHVSPNKKSAIIRHFGSGNQQEIHIQHARFITLPTDTTLRRLWNDIATKYASTTLLDPQLRERYIKDFWEELEDLQSPVRDPERFKRRRLDYDSERGR
jgi:transposase InsO family protein